ncbi:MAG: PEP-CTERM sorting domain-containing protein [Planctomycetia bacterium]|nr:PEP-CTERM sorting domain-containing protein [Planctomycetia bacterium]
MTVIRCGIVSAIVWAASTSALLAQATTSLQIGRGFNVTVPTTGALANAPMAGLVGSFDPSLGFLIGAKLSLTGEGYAAGQVSQLAIPGTYVAAPPTLWSSDFFWYGSPINPDLSLVGSGTFEGIPENNGYSSGSAYVDGGVYSYSFWKHVPFSATTSQTTSNLTRFISQPGYDLGLAQVRLSVSQFQPPGNSGISYSLNGGEVSGTVVATYDYIPNSTFDGTNYTFQFSPEIDGLQSQLNLVNESVVDLSEYQTLKVGTNGAGSLSIASGSKLTTSYWNDLGVNLGSTGSATITGIGSKWDANTIRVGLNGSGTTTVSDGGILTTDTGELGVNVGSTGNATITGPGSQWNATSLRVGEYGSGTLAIDNGGTVISNNSTLGVYNGSTGDATITGIGSTWNNNVQLTVGSGGAGTLLVSDGGTVNSNYASLGFGFDATGSATITGIGSTWNIADPTNYLGTLKVGEYHGSGTLLISDGGKVTSESGVIGYNSSGNATVTGSGSSWITDGLSVGDLGTGTLTVANSGLLSASGGVGINYGGTLNLQSGGRLQVGQLNIQEGGTFNFTGGTLSITSPTGYISAPSGYSFDLTNKSLVNNGQVSAPVVVGVGGVVKGGGTFFGQVTINAGGIGSPGNSPGVMTDTSTTWNAGGKYVWEINDLNGVAGPTIGNPGWDLWNLGTLTLNSTSGDPFLIEMHSVTTGSPPSSDTALAGWNPAQHYSWKIATADSNVFTEAALTSLLIDPSSPFFASNGTNGSFFHLASSNGGKQLDLEYDPAAVPEPSSMLLAGMVAVPVAWRKLRRRKPEGT